MIRTLRLAGMGTLVVVLVLVFTWLMRHPALAQSRVGDAAACQRQLNRVVVTLVKERQDLAALRRECPALTAQSIRMAAAQAAAQHCSTQETVWIPCNCVERIAGPRCDVEEWTKKFEHYIRTGELPQ